MLARAIRGGKQRPKKRNDQNKGARTSGVTFILVVQTAEP
jgi:hypothetical protein